VQREIAAEQERSEHEQPTLDELHAHRIGS
jgi:hypothetical protein